METIQAVRTRRSIRAFLPDAVPEADVRQLLDESRWAPSWANAQGWDVWVVEGRRLAAVKSMLGERFEQQAEPVTDVRMPARGEWPEQIAARMTYRRPAPGEAPQPPSRPGLSELYGAPVMLLFGVHEQLAVEYACFDLGLLVENVCLIAADRGLGTCLMAMAVRYGDALHELVPEASGRRIVIAVALGYADPGSELNKVERERCAFGEIATFLE